MSSEIIYVLIVCRIYGPTKMEEIIDIPDVMFSPARMRKWEFYDELLTTLTLDSAQTVDAAVADGVSIFRLIKI